MKSFKPDVFLLFFFTIVVNALLKSRPGQWPSRWARCDKKNPIRKFSELINVTYYKRNRILSRIWFKWMVYIASIHNHVYYIYIFLFLTQFKREEWISLTGLVYEVDMEWDNNREYRRQSLWRQVTWGPTHMALLSSQKPGPYNVLVTRRELKVSSRIEHAFVNSRRRCANHRVESDRRGHVPRLQKIMEIYYSIFSCFMDYFPFFLKREYEMDTFYMLQGKA